MSTQSKFRLGWQAVFAGALSVALAHHATADVTIDHVDRGAFNSMNALGYWKETGGSYEVRAINPIVLPGFDGGALDFTHNYHVFDLSNLTGTITGATLRIYTAANAWESGAASETLGLFDVSTPDSELLAGDGGTNPSAVFGDLGTGISYGSATFTSADVSNFVDATLNTDAVDALNASVGNGTWSVGGALTTIDSSYGTSNTWEGILFGSGDSSPATELILTGTVVPEPASAAVLSLVSLALVATRQRRSC